VARADYADPAKDSGAGTYLAIAWEPLKSGGQATIAIGGEESFADRNFFPKPQRRRSRSPWTPLGASGKARSQAKRVCLIVGSTASSPASVASFSDLRPSSSVASIRRRAMTRAARPVRSGVSIARSTDLRSRNAAYLDDIANLGLTVADRKRVLACLQHEIVAAQARRRVWSPSAHPRPRFARALCAARCGRSSRRSLSYTSGPKS
jgi:hypothetical protein